MGARQHRRVRRKPEERHDLRPIGRWWKNGHAHRHAFGEGTLSSRDHHEHARRHGNHRTRTAARDRGGRGAALAPRRKTWRCRPAAEDAGWTNRRCSHRRIGPRRRAGRTARPCHRHLVAVHTCRGRADDSRPSFRTGGVGHLGNDSDPVRIERNRRRAVRCA